MKSKVLQKKERSETESSRGLGAGVQQRSPGCRQTDRQTAPETDGPAAGRGRATAWRPKHTNRLEAELSCLLINPSPSKPARKVTTTPKCRLYPLATCHFFLPRVCASRERFSALSSVLPGTATFVFRQQKQPTFKLGFKKLWNWTWEKGGPLNSFWLKQRKTKTRKGVMLNFYHSPSPNQLGNIQKEVTVLCFDFIFAPFISLVCYETKATKLFLKHPRRSGQRKGMKQDWHKNPYSQQKSLHRHTAFPAKSAYRCGAFDFLTASLLTLVQCFADEVATKLQLFCCKLAFLVFFNGSTGKHSQRNVVRKPSPAVFLSA